MSGSSSKTSSTDPTTQSAIDYMTQVLTSWGLSSLLPDALSYINQGITDPNEIELKLENTDAYKQRFAGNLQRIANGYSALSEADYISTEDSYKQVLQQYGLDNSSYASQDFLADLIGKNISPSEVQERAQIAHDQYEAAPQYVKDLWTNYFGTKGDAIAYILDPNVSTQTIADESQQVAIGGAAASHGINVSQGRAQQFQQAGVTTSQATQAFDQIAQTQNTDKDIARRFGTSFTLNDEENDLLLGDADAANKRKTMYAEEKGLFNGGVGANANSLAVSQNY